MKEIPITLRLPATVTLHQKMPWQAIIDALWTLNMGIKTIQEDIVEVIEVNPKPASCSKCEEKAVFKRGPYFYCPIHYMELLQDSITQS